MKQKKTLLLMGASGGIGQQMIPAFLAAGYQLALHYHEQSETLEKRIGTLDTSSPKVKLYQADITKEQEISELVQRVRADFSSIDILVNNAGISVSGMSWKQSLEDWEKALAINLTGPFLTIKHVLPMMREQQWGRIINISSVVAQTGVPGTSAYAASKAGLFGMSRSVAKEVANKNITVNTLALGYFDAGMLYGLSEAMREHVQQSIPQQRFGDAKEIAACILHLCSDAASYTTGQVINLNGGLY